ncbi:HlyD family secretion protein [Sphingobacterium hungaricum]
MSKQTPKKKTLIVRVLNTLVILILVAGIIWAVSAYLRIGNDKYTNSAQVEEFINPINTRVSAYVKEIRFIEHQPVKAGDTLIILDDREILTQLGQAEANLQNALAAKNATHKSIATQGNNVNTASANIDAARARLWNLEQNYTRYATLLKEEAVTQQQYDQVRAEYEAAQAQYNAVRNTKNSSELTVQEVESRLNINDAEISRAQNALEMAKLNHSYCFITAPHNGIMGRRTVNIGQLLTTPGQQVATIVDNRQKWVTANFREKQMHKVQIGQKVNVKVDALNGKSYEMKVTAISGATGARYSAIPVDNSTGNFVKVQQRIPIRLEFTDSNKPEDLAQLCAGMNVEVTLQ